MLILLIGQKWTVSFLSVRATNVLLANVTFLEELNLMGEKILSSFQNCGKKTIQEILNFVHAIRFQGEIKSPVSTKELLSAPPIKSTIALLPIFSNDVLDDVTIKDLNLAFCAEVKFKDILWVHCPHNLKSICPKPLNAEKWGECPHNYKGPEIYFYNTFLTVILIN